MKFTGGKELASQHFFFSHILAGPSCVIQVRVSFNLELGNLHRWENRLLLDSVW